MAFGYSWDAMTLTCLLLFMGADFQKSAFARCAALDDSGQNSREGVFARS